MKPDRVLTTRIVVILALAASLAGCGAADDGPASSPSATPTASPEPAAIVVDPSAPLEPQMDAAIEADDLAAVEEILAAGFDPEAEIRDGLNALHVAAYANAADLVLVLVEAGVPLEEKANGMTPLTTAAGFADAETVTAFLEAGADVTAQHPGLLNALPIQVAARWGNIDAIQALLDWGVPVDQVDAVNATALNYAAYFGSLDAVLFLVEQGADINHRDDYGDTPLASATRAGRTEVAEALAEQGAEG